MNINYTREISNDFGTFGHMTCERYDRDWGIGENNQLSNLPIEPNRYQLKWYDSPEHGKIPCLQNVPNHDYIEMHVGCFPNHNPDSDEPDSKGCLLVGDIYEDLGTGDGMQVVSSKMGFGQFLTAIANEDPELENTWITIQ